MVTHLSGFVPFCGILEFLFFYNLYSNTGETSFQSLLFVFSSAERNNNVLKRDFCRIYYHIRRLKKIEAGNYIDKSAS